MRFCQGIWNPWAARRLIARRILHHRRLLMARTSEALFAGMFLLVSVYGPAETATAAVSRDPSANIYGSSAGAPIYAASKENQIGSRSRVAPNVKPIAPLGSASATVCVSRARPKDFATHPAID